MNGAAQLLGLHGAFVGKITAGWAWILKERLCLTSVENQSKSGNETNPSVFFLLIWKLPKKWIFLFCLWPEREDVTLTNDSMSEPRHINLDNRALKRRAPSVPRAGSNLVPSGARCHPRRLLFLIMDFHFFFQICFPFTVFAINELPSSKQS